MGIELVKFIVAKCGKAKLSGNAHKVLVAMATTALDQPNSKKQPARLYFGGWEPLALALGFEVDDPAEPGLTPGKHAARERNRRKAKEAVRRAVKELREAGIITPTAGIAHTGTRQSYRLELTLAAWAKWSPGLGSQVAPRIGGSVGPRSGGNWPPGLGSPRTNTGSHEDLSQESISHPSASTTGHAREDAAMDEIYVRASKPHTFQPDAHGASCEVCDLPKGHRRHDERSVA